MSLYFVCLLVYYVYELVNVCISVCMYVRVLCKDGHILYVVCVFVYMYVHLYACLVRYSLYLLFSGFYSRHRLVAIRLVRIYSHNR